MQSPKNHIQIGGWNQLVAN